MKACCFTGYRPEKSPFPYDTRNAEYIRFENKLLEAIGQTISDGYDTFYCGGAMGFDLLAAELLLIMRPLHNFRLVVAVPYVGQENGFSDDWKARYKKVLSQADEIVYVSQEYHMRCFAERNEYMVDNSERIIAFCDGKKGGTLNTLRYARRKNREIINIAETPAEKFNFTLFEVIEE